jgi:hypothetical protein
MPAVIPFLPLIATAVGVGGSAYLANKNKQTQGDLLKKQQGIAQPATTSGQQLTGMGTSAIGQGLNYYASRMANPAQATAPEQNQVSNLYSGQAANIRNQYGRGGFGPTQAQTTANQSMAVRQGIIQQAPGQAAAGLSGLGTQATSLGYQGQGLGAGIYGNVFQQGLTANQQGYNQMSGAGNALFQAYQQYLLQKAAQPPGQSTQNLSTVPVGGNSSLWGSGNINLPPSSAPSVPNSGASGDGGWG